jgi:hypothetical protein
VFVGDLDQNCDFFPQFWGAGRLGREFFGHPGWYWVQLIRVFDGNDARFGYTTSFAIFFNNLGRRIIAFSSVGKVR